MVNRAFNYGIRSITLENDQKINVSIPIDYELLAAIFEPVAFPNEKMIKLKTSDRRRLSLVMSQTTEFKCEFIQQFDITSCLVIILEDEWSNFHFDTGNSKILKKVRLKTT